MIFTIFLIGLLFLAYFVFSDIKRMEVENLPILAMFLVGMGISVWNGQFFSTMLGFALFGTFGWYLWKKEAIGGADVKILAVLPFFMGSIGLPNLLVSLWVFLILMMMVTLPYVVINRLVGRKGKFIPFIPIIAITYVCFWVFRVSVW